MITSKQIKSTKTPHHISSKQHKSQTIINTYKLIVKQRNTINKPSTIKHKTQKHKIK